jgi:hypothetical protein
LHQICANSKLRFSVGGRGPSCVRVALYIKYIRTFRFKKHTR